MEKIGPPKNIKPGTLEHRLYSILQTQKEEGTTLADAWRFATKSGIDCSYQALVDANHRLIEKGAFPQGNSGGRDNGQVIVATISEASILDRFEVDKEDRNRKFIDERNRTRVELVGAASRGIGYLAGNVPAILGQPSISVFCSSEGINLGQLSGQDLVALEVNYARELCLAQGYFGEAYNIASIANRYRVNRIEKKFQPVRQRVHSLARFFGDEFSAFSPATKELINKIDKEKDEDEGNLPLIKRRAIITEWVRYITGLEPEYLAEILGISEKEVEILLNIKNNFSRAEENIMVSFFPGENSDAFFKKEKECLLSRSGGTIRVVITEKERQNLTKIVNNGEKDSDDSQTSED